MKFTRILAFVGLSISNCLPINGFAINLGQRRIRQFFTRLFVEKCGCDINIQKNARFSHTCVIGDNSGIGENCRFYGKVIIGNDVMIGPECMIFTTNHEYRDRNTIMRLQGPMTEKPVVIGNDVWIGARVIILPGVIVEEGAVIGAGSVVTKNVPAYSVVGGNPAVLLKSRV